MLLARSFKWYWGKIIKFWSIVINCENIVFGFSYVGMLWRCRHSCQSHGPRFTKNLKSNRNRKPISVAKMRFTKIVIWLLWVFSNVTLRVAGVFVTIMCLHTMALVVIFPEDEDVRRLYRNLNLKLFYETASWFISSS